MSNKEIGVLVMVSLMFLGVLGGLLYFTLKWPDDEDIEDEIKDYLKKLGK